MYLRPLIILIVTSLAACAANNKVEVFGQGGLYIETGRDAVNAGLVGGGAGYLIRPKIALFGEFNYIRAFSIPAAPYLAAYGIQSGGGVRVYLSQKPRTVRPFVGGTGGFFRATVSGQIGFPAWGILPFPVSASSNSGYLGAGFGAEIGPSRFGARPEARYLRELSSGGSDSNALAIICGVYYRF